MLKDLREREGLTYILVSHDLAVVSHLCDRVAVMQDGGFVEIATKNQLLRSTVKHPCPHDADGRQQRVFSPCVVIT